MNQTNQKVFWLVSFLWGTTFVLPAFYVFIGTETKIILGLLVCLLGFLSSQNMGVIKKASFLFIIFFFIELFVIFFQPGLFATSLNYNISELLQRYIDILAGVYVFDNIKYLGPRSNKFIFRAFCLMIAYTCLFSITALVSNPELVRMSINEQLSSSYSRLMNFNHAYSFILLAPLCMLLLKLSKISKVLWGTYFALIIFAIIFSSFTLSYFVLAIEMVSSLILMQHGERSGKKIFIYILVIGGIVVLIYNLADVLNWISTVIDSPSVSIRIREIQVAMSGKTAEGDLGARIKTYSDSIASFVTHPLGAFGWNAKSIVTGGHSRILDMFAKYGIFTFLYFVFWRSFYKSGMDNIPEMYQGAWKAVFIGGLAIEIINPFLEGYLLFFGPIMLQLAIRCIIDSDQEFLYAADDF